MTRCSKQPAYPPTLIGAAVIPQRSYPIHWDCSIHSDLTVGDFADMSNTILSHIFILILQ